MKKVLGIETSCDETAVAIVSSDKKILSHLVYSQIREHEAYGGVVPEIAARAHIEALESMIKQAMLEAKIDNFSDLDAIAVTSGPGLIGGVIVGVMTAKGIASAANIPLIGVNHLEGHALTTRLTDDIEFPFLLLLVSGGHCQILAVEAVGKYTKIGGTIDDAVGEAFDKVAKMLKLPYPGGPKVEQLAKDGDENRFDFPRSFKGKKHCDFSFSGLKSSVKRQIDKLENISEKDKSDICASFQLCVKEILQDRVSRAIKIFSKQYPNAKNIVVSGGVAANKYLNAALSETAAMYNFTLSAPEMKLCTDNGAMIAWAGIERLQLGLTDPLSIVPKARWPLEDLKS
ncbi:tRNA (adenosine(37)-N6)-threonylcarbamoyltransferase complex transferase subunit TsaD [Rickettsiales bacterium]|nr:tRNA (adenosine(37)-N6)-threonylcarbamoyltransferase complex transferase subunit TsaD [Rickettsiales bacterium]